MKLIASSENIEDFLESDFVYVDKTEYIYNLIRNHKRVFFSRPRRFGKSLTLNTIGNLFEKGVDPYFKGTQIYNKWNQDRYPVLHLNFLNLEPPMQMNLKKFFQVKQLNLQIMSQNVFTVYPYRGKGRSFVKVFYFGIPDVLPYPHAEGGME